VTWMDCESKGKFEETFLAAMDSVLASGTTQAQ